MLSPHSAEIATDKKAQSDKQASFEVDISCFVILPESQSASGCQERRKRCPLGSVLAHMEEINQHRNNHDAATNAHETGKHTYRQAKQDVEKSHGRNNRRKQLFIENRER